jgi:hypothetical protein
MQQEKHVGQSLPLLLLCALFMSAPTVSAHRLDEYLQAAQITLTPDAVNIELRLTPGVNVADRVFALIDLDHNKQISTAEEQAYAERVLQDVTLEIDGQRIPLVLSKIQCPSNSEMKEGTSAIRLDLFSKKTLAPGDHQLLFNNTHLPKLSVYQANALLPATDAIQIVGQQRDTQQHEFQMQFRILSAVGTPANLQAEGRSMNSMIVIGLLLGVGCLTALLTQRKRLYNLVSKQR